MLSYLTTHTVFSTEVNMQRQQSEFVLLSSVPSSANALHNHKPFAAPVAEQETHQSSPPAVKLWVSPSEQLLLNVSLTAPWAPPSQEPPGNLTSLHPALRFWLLTRTAQHSHTTQAFSSK